MGRSMLLVACVALLALAVAPSFAQNARVYSMGYAGVGLADDEGASGLNPAGLPYLKTWSATDEETFNRASVTTDLESDADELGILYAGRNKNGKFGWGLGYGSQDWGDGWEDTIYGAAFGIKIGETGWSAGINAQRWEEQWPVTPTQAVIVEMNTTVFDVGILYTMPTETALWRFGAVGRDVTDEWGDGVWFDAGASVELPNGLIIAADIEDVTDEFETMFNVGAEYMVPTVAGLAVRAGIADDDLTAGVGYRWGAFQLDFAYEDFDVDDWMSLTGTVCW